MKNITVTMPDDLARQTRILAAEADTSMSQFLCRLVQEKAENNAGYRAAMKRYLSRGSQKIRETGQPLPTREEIHDRNALR